MKKGDVNFRRDVLTCICNIKIYLYKISDGKKAFQIAHLYKEKKKVSVKNYNKAQK